MARILMCPPDYFGIEYEINPWMKVDRGSDPALSRIQWKNLHDLLVELGTEIELMTPVKGLPDLVFTANAALIWKNRAYVARFRHQARQGETPLDEEWFQSHGFEVRHLPDNWNFEGAGDALFCGNTLFGGYLIRSDAGGLHWLAKDLGCRVIPLQLESGHFYHLDTCFCPLSPNEAIYFPEAFDDYARRALEEQIEILIPVVPEEAARFGCNAVVVGNDVVLNTGCPRLEESLVGRGYKTHATELGEFIKSGGSAKCLTLRLDGEEAAIWE